MPNATDIITYIGVPLAVLGVMPLLWNMAKSFIIRYRLQSSLPKDARKHYSLIMNPAAGNVSVGVDTPRLDLRVVLQSFLWTPSPRPVVRIEKVLLNESWMVFEYIGIFPSYTGTRQRFTVGYDLRVETVGLKCSWLAFAVFSLALGVDLYRGGLLDLRRHISTNLREMVLKSSNGESIIQVRKQENRILAHVVPIIPVCFVRKGLAWACAMIEAHGKDLHVVLLGMPDIGSEISYLNDQYSAYKLHVHYIADTGPTQATERALVWVLYAETYYHEFVPVRMETSDRVLPVTQEILKIREDVIEELKFLNDLEASLDEIFSGEKSLVRTMVTALGHEWDTRVEDKGKSRAYTENPPGYVDVWKDLQGNDTFKALKDNYHPVPTFRTRSDADLAQLTTPMAVLARVIIAVSSIQKWPREEWSVEMDGCFKVPADPMDELFYGYDISGPYSLFSNYGESIYFE